MKKSKIFLTLLTPALISVKGYDWLYDKSKLNPNISKPEPKRPLIPDFPENRLNDYYKTLIYDWPKPIASTFKWLDPYKL